MALKILENCIRCAACEEECPREAISSGDDVYWIDPPLCDECAGEKRLPLCVEACPIDGCIAPAAGVAACTSPLVESA
jgi:ferredoxin